MFLIFCALSSVFVPTTSAQANDGYVGIYSDSLGSTPCATVPPLTGATLYVIAKTAGSSANGITGAEFRIEVTNPGGWLLSYTRPGAANLELGNPIDTDPDPDAGGGLILAFPSCQAPDGSGQVRLGTLSVFNLNGGSTELLVKRHSQPSNVGHACPLFVKCDFSLLCMTAATADSCTLAPEKAVVTASDDLPCFVAALNSDISAESDPDPEPPDRDPEPELPPDDGPQLLAMLKAGAVNFPPGVTRASLATTTIRSAQLATILANHDVQAISKAFPYFNLADTLGTARTGEAVRFMDYSRIYRLSLPLLGDAESLRTALRGVPEVLFVHHDGGVKLDGVCTFDSIPGCETTVTNCPNDSLFDQQWSLVNWGETGTCDADIDADEAWELATGSEVVTIGIIDQPIVETHEDVVGKVAGDTIPVGQGALSHGTWVACIAAANTNNSKGIAGVDHNARLVSIQLEAQTDVGDSIIASKVRNAAANGLHVLNNSWALADSSGNVGRFSHTVRWAFRDYYMSNGVVVASMGNCGDPSALPSYCGGELSPIQYPAAFGQGIIAVGATGQDDAVAPFSSRGNHIDVAAPGVDILGCWPNAGPSGASAYAKNPGTSASAPHVAGLAGLLFSYALNDSLAELGIVIPPLYNDDVEQLIRLSAEDLGQGQFNDEYGMGRINARAALDRLRLPNRLHHDQAVGGALQTSDWQGQMCFLYPPPGLADGWYTAFRYPVETTVTFPTTFASPPHVWGRGVETIGYSTDGSDSGFDNVNYGMGWCEAVGTITASSCTLRTYVYSLRDSVGAHIAWAPTDAANVKYAYSVLGELQPTDVDDFTAGEALGLGPRLTSMNPLRSDGRLRVWLPNPAGVQLAIYDVSGRLVRLLHTGQMAAGGHEFTWDGRTANGGRVSSGLYFARLQAGDRVLSHKLVVLR